MNMCGHVSFVLGMYLEGKFLDENGDFEKF